MSKEEYKVDARIWKRESTQEWVLELSGAINDQSFICRHTEPLSVAPEDVAGLPSHYNITQAAANKAAEEGGLRFAELSINQKRALSEGLSALEAMADIWAAEIRLSEMAQRIADAPAEQRPCTIAAMIEQAFIEGAYRHFLDHKDAADCASRQVANKAEVDLSNLHRYTPVIDARNGEVRMDPDAIEGNWLHRDDVELLLADSTPPATTGASTAPVETFIELRNRVAALEAELLSRDVSDHVAKYSPASTVLTDERIDATMIKYSTMIAPGVYSLCNFGCDDDMRSFAREVAAQAGQVAVPEAWGLYAEVDGVMVLQYPVRFSKSECEADARIYVDGTKIEIRPMVSFSPAKESK